jgi:hypothetical protein
LVHPDAQRRQLVNPTGGKRPKRGGGRAKGQQNIISRSVRQSILEGINRAGGGGPEGVVRYVHAAAKESYRYGIAMLALVTPKAVEAVVRHEEVLLSIEDLDRSLVEAGLPPTREIFHLGYYSDSNADASEVAPEAAKEGEQS